MSNQAPPHRSASLADVVTRLAVAAATTPVCTLSIDGAGLRTKCRGQLTLAIGSEIRILISGDAAEAGFERWSEDGVAATVCVRADQQDLVFFTRVIRACAVPSADGSGGRDVEVTLAMPRHVISTHRRRTFRVAVIESDRIDLRVWRIDNYAILRDQPPPSRNLRASLCDLSANGMRACLWAGRVQALGLSEGLRFRVEIKAAEGEMILEARLRYPRETDRDDEFAYCGFEFIHDDDDFDSRRNRQKLDAILARLQRTAARRESD